MTHARVWAAACAAGVLTSCATAPDVHSAGGPWTARTLPQIVQALEAGEVASVELVEAYLARIEAIDRGGPRLQAVLSLNPDARAVAAERDAERARGEARGPLHGVPVLIKDNIETRELPTTAGSLALAANDAGRDAPAIAGLRASGAIILGKTNLSEWANFRSTRSTSGWSARGGQVRNPHVVDRSPCGSSSGSGAAAAAGLAAATVGTETNGSIICPATMNGVVGFKPTVGLISQEGIVPISSTQDTAGPMTRTVEGAAMMLTAMAGPDGEELARLAPDGLAGRRVGVARFALGDDPDLVTVFDAALDILDAAGAERVDIEAHDTPDDLWPNQFAVLQAEFKATLNAYLAEAPAAVAARSLEALIAFNTAHADVELSLFGQEIFEMANEAPALDDAAYLRARDAVLVATRARGIDQILEENGLDLIVAPSWGPAFLIDPVNGDQFEGGVGIGWMAAMAGYPHLTVPMGVVDGLPVGLSFIATAGDDAAVLAAGHAFEQSAQARRTPAFRPTAEAVEAIGTAMAPAR